ncbi:MFS transporter [Nocardia asteroides]|uniref:MFS transporter n=1 Tax=Nocardia asteroides TaxID=1824 RepID=UPI003412D0BB
MNATLTTLTRRYVVLNVLGWLPTGLCAPVLILLLAARGIDMATMGALLAAYGLTAAALELPTGGLADVVGRRPVLLAASLLFLVSAVSIGIGTSVLVLATGILLEAAGRALDSGPLQAWYVDAAHAADPDVDLTAGFARARTAGSIALAVGALLGGALAGWVPLPSAGAAPILALSLPYLVAAGVVAVRLVVQQIWVDDIGRGPRAADLRAVAADIPRTVGAGLRTCARNGVLRRITVLCGVFGVVLAAVELLAPLQIAQGLGGDQRAVGVFAVVTACGGFAMAAGAAAAPPLSRLLGSVRYTVLAALALTAIAVAALGTPLLALSAAGYILVYLALGAPEPLLDVLTHRAATTAERATVLSVQSLALRVCGSLGALAAGLLATSVSPAAIPALLVAVLALGGLTALGLPTRDRSADENPTAVESRPGTTLEVPA